MGPNNQVNAMSALNCGLNDQMQLAQTNATSYIGDVQTSGSLGNAAITMQWFPPGTTAWDYWQNFYYPQVIYQSYPVYIRERAMDKGKQAFEIIKILKDKKLVKLEKVGDFIDLMDELIKIL